MWHELDVRVEELFATLVKIDEELAAKVQAAGCRCGGPLHRADYPRKPRGLPAAWEAAYERRLSLCCGREGCRRRSTPPSVRFFGRRVYVGAVVLAVAGAWAKPRRANVPRRTARRWRRYFRRMLVRLEVWQTLRARVLPVPDEGELPRSLLDRFTGDRTTKLVRALTFLSPVTTGLPAGFVMVG